MIDKEHFFEMNRKKSLRFVFSPPGYKILNLGSGDDEYGDVRFDVVKRKHVTHVGSLEDPLPFENYSFDEVYARQIFEHVPNPLQLLLEMKRVCKPGGFIKIITDNGGFMLFHHNLSGIMHGDYSYTGKFDERDMHYAFFQPEHIRNFFTRAGIELERLELVDSDVWLGWKEKIVRTILRILFGKRHGYQNIIAVGRVRHQ